MGHNILFNTLINTLLFNFVPKKGGIQVGKERDTDRGAKGKRSLLSRTHLRKTVQLEKTDWKE